MKIAIEGCAHGELEKIYDTIAFLEKENNTKVDVLLCCGDFQASRNLSDLECMAVPPKYRDLCTFYKYYSGEKVAPILTIVIGGNHEASNYFQELAYGGWLAPNIYYLGHAGVVDIGGVRIAGISGIYKSKDYYKGRYETVPYSEDTKRSCYHIRALDVFRLKQLSKPVHIIMSHDWPDGVYNHGNVNALINKKPFLKSDIDSNSLGSPPAAELLHHLQPEYWFSAHLHVKFAAVVRHDDDHETKFLALDKCLPRRQFLQVVDIPHEGPIELKYDSEWLTILQLTDHLTSIRRSNSYLPGPGCGQRWVFTPTEEEVETIKKRLENNLVVPLNFIQTAPPYDANSPPPRLSAQPNPQTTAFCNLIGIDDPLALLLDQNPGSRTSMEDGNKLNYSSFQMSGDAEALDVSSSSPVKLPTRTPMKLPEPQVTTLTLPDSTETVTRTPMKLPPPQVSSVKAEASSSSTPPKSLSSDSLLTSTPVSGGSDDPVSSSCDFTSNRDEDVAEVGTTGEPQSSEVSESPKPKRFHRRNMALYTSED